MIQQHFEFKRKVGPECDKWFKPNMNRHGQAPQALLNWHINCSGEPQSSILWYTLRIDWNQSEFLYEVSWVCPHIHTRSSLSNKIQLSTHLILHDYVPEDYTSHRDAIHDLMRHTLGKPPHASRPLEHQHNEYEKSSPREAITRLHTKHHAIDLTLI